MGADEISVIQAVSHALSAEHVCKHCHDFIQGVFAFYLAIGKTGASCHKGKSPFEN